MQLTILLPTYNERENVRQIIPLIEELVLKGVKGEIVVVDDMSPDGTGDEVRALDKRYGNVRLIEKPKKEGIGAALRVGYDAAKGDIILSADADMQFKVEDMGKLLAAIDQGADLAVGSRYVRHGKAAGSNPIKRFISRGGNFLIRLALGLPVHDVSANFRAIKRRVWQELRTKEKTNSLLLEMILEAHHRGYKVVEVPVSFHPRRFGQSKLNLRKEVPKFLGKVLRFWWRYRVKKVSKARHT